MAQAVLAAALPGRQVSSAGLDAMLGFPADPIACDLMHERGLDIDAHRARSLDAQVCRRADLILVMDLEQRRELERRHPLAKGKVFRLGEFGAGDIADPYRAGRRAFEEALARIDEGASHWAQRISKVAS
jgi:protein-tyrosine phosphatase